MGSPFSFTVSEFIEAFRDTVGDPKDAGTTRFGPDYVVRVGNRAQVALVKDIQGLVLETQWTDIVTTGRTEYTAPPGFLQDKLVVYQHADDDRRPLDFITLDEYRDRIARNPTHEGEPTHYWMWRKLGNDTLTYNPTTINLYPKPSSAASLNPIRIWGWKLPDKLENTTTGLTRVIEIPPQYIDAMIFRAAMIAAGDSRDFTGKAQFRQDYEAEVVRIEGQNARKSRSRQPRLKPRASILLPAPDPYRLPARPFGGY